MLRLTNVLPNRLPLVGNTETNSVLCCLNEKVNFTCLLGCDIANIMFSDDANMLILFIVISGVTTTSSVSEGLSDTIDISQ